MQRSRRQGSRFQQLRTLRGRVGCWYEVVEGKECGARNLVFSMRFGNDVRSDCPRTVQEPSHGAKTSSDRLLGLTSRAASEISPSQVARVWAQILVPINSALSYGVSLGCYFRVLSLQRNSSSFLWRRLPGQSAGNSSRHRILAWASMQGPLQPCWFTEEGADYSRGVQSTNSPQFTDTADWHFA